MKSSPDKSAVRIIRGADVKGVSFCGPRKEFEKQEEEQQNLKVLEEYWFSKGLEEGQEKGYAKGLKEGETEAREKGLVEGREEVREPSFKAGKEEGLQEGKRLALEEMQAELELLKKLMTELHAAKKNVIEENKEEMLELLFSISGQILMQQIKDEGVWSELLKKLIDTAKPVVEDEPLKIHISSADYQRFEATLARFSQDASFFSSVQFIDNPELKEGQLSVRCSLGLVNFDLERQLGELKEEIKKTAPIQA